MRFTSRYPLEPHGPKRLEIIHNIMWSEVLVRLDGRLLGTTSEDELVKGVEFVLRDQSVLRVWIEFGPRRARFLYLTRNGHPLPGSEGDPLKIIRDTLVIIGGVAVVQISFAGLVTFSGNPDQSIQWMMGLGLVLLLLVFLAAQRSLPAMTLAAALCFVEIVILFVTQVHWNWAAVFPIGFALFLTGWLLWRGVAAMRTLKASTLPIRHPPEPIRRE